MIVLTIRTDKPDSEIGIYNDKKQIAYVTWEAHRRLAETLHKKIQALLEEQKMSWQDIGGIVVYEGPGSFTGLRIGISIANALSYGLQQPITGSQGEAWIQDGLKVVMSNKNSLPVVPFYGADANITTPKK
jgi:tRNA threonylcarbamoyladenosine biosynthesis protein TsaB